MLLHSMLAFSHLQMNGVFKIFLLFCFLLLFAYPSSSLPMCTDLRAPVIRRTPLAFCPYNGSVCCNSAKDLQLQKQFEEMDISDLGCASAMKSILCATCDKFSAELFRVDSVPRSVPVLCNSSVSENSFCSTVWEACQNISILNSPFAPSLQSKAGVPQNTTSTKLTDIWISNRDFCEAFGGISDKDILCFNGEPISLDNSETTLPPDGLCLEKIGNGSYLNMVAHPDGSNRAFFSNQPGKIWLATIPEMGSGEAIGLDESSPFVDLTDEVYYDAKFGMMGMAFHPNFAKNGRFFASYNCDKVKSTRCSGRCACNSDVSCDPSKLPSSNGVQPCQYHIVVAEFSANGTSSEPAMAIKAKPFEVRRILTLGLPSTASHGGQILFGPTDGYMYIMTGDGESKGDPYNFAQNKKSLLGKIMRLNVDNVPSAEELASFDIWGNYSIPRDNPYSEDKEWQPEIWALGLRNPWRCSFDAERPSYFLCADIGQDKYEEVDIITKGGNYGWPIYEGPILSNPQQSTRENTTTDSLAPIFPVVGYRHSDVNKREGSAAILGGYIYRSMTDPCIHGSYLYADLYASTIWAATEIPKNSGNFTTNTTSFRCAHDSPIKCNSVPNSLLPALGYIYSFGEDNRKDIFILASSGVYRIVGPSRCNYTCSKETVTAFESPESPSHGNHLSLSHVELFMFLTSLLVLLGFIL